MVSNRPTRNQMEEKEQQNIPQRGNGGRRIRRGKLMKGAKKERKKNDRTGALKLLFCVW